MLLSCFLAAVVLLVPDDRTADFDPHLDIIRKKIQDALRGVLTRRDLIEEAIQQQGRELFEDYP
jgi:hypothetical protein